MAQQVPDPERCALGGVDEKPRVMVDDLERDPSRLPSDDGLALPQGLGHGQAESLADRLLDHDVGAALQRVDRAVRIGGQEQDVDVRILARRLADLLQDRRALGIVVGRPPGQDELRGELLPDQAVRLDDADGVLEPVEPGHLQQHRALGVEPEPLGHTGDVLVREVEVLVAQRIDARGDEVLGMRERLGERGQGEHAGVAVADELPEERPDGAVRAADVDVAPPDPLPTSSRAQRQQRRGLRVVDEHEVGLLEYGPEPLGVALVDLEVGVQEAAADVDRAPLQGVVKPLRRREELRIARDHLPRGGQAELPLQRHELRQDLGDATSGARRVHVDDARPLEPARQPADVIDDAGARDTGVGVEPRAHGPPFPRASSKQPPIRSRSSVSDHRK
jgi:hypothetical protein